MKKMKIVGKLINNRIIIAFLLGILIGIGKNLLNLPESMVILACLIAFFFFLYVYTLLNKEIRKAIKELYDKCDPYKFLEIIDEMDKYIKNPKSIKNCILLDKAAGLIESGNFDEGINTLKEININELGRKFKAMYYNNMACCYIWKLEFKNAEDNLNKLLELIDSGKLNKKFVELIKNSYNLNRIYCDMYKGKFENGIEQLEEMYLQANNLSLKVSCKFAIGYHYMNKDNVKAKECFEYVVANGNKLYVAKKAQEYLEKMETNF